MSYSNEQQSKIGTEGFSQWLYVFLPFSERAMSSLASEIKSKEITFYLQCNIKKWIILHIAITTLCILFFKRKAKIWYFKTKNRAWLPHKRRKYYNAAILAPVFSPLPLHPPTQSSQACKLTGVAGTPGLVTIIASDPQDPLLDGRAVDVLHWARGLEVLLDGLVHHQVLELSELRADVRKPSGAHVGRLAHPAGEERHKKGRWFLFVFCFFSFFLCPQQDKVKAKD